MSDIRELVGKTFSRVVNMGTELRFVAADGTGYKFFHAQDCCESVTVEDVDGPLHLLEGVPILEAEEVIYNGENPPGVKAPRWQDHFTWTFYKFATRKGRITVRWYGESNGYYSESVDFAALAG